MARLRNNNKTKLRLILRKLDGRINNESGSEEGPLEGSCGYGNELSGPVNGENCIG